MGKYGRETVRKKNGDKNVKKMGERKGLRKEGAMTRREILHFRERMRKKGR